MIGGRRPIKGRKPADRRVRVERPHSAFFRYTGPGQMVAKPAASVALTPTGRFLDRTRAILFGRPLASEEEIGERLSKRKALAIFSSDAISSSAYATEEILRVLLVAGASALLLSVEVAIAIAILLAVVSVSYRQVCQAYPNGGGAYVVARTNLAPIMGLIAAAALLIDYVMTVAVSTAAAIAQIQSVIPEAYDYRIVIAFISISLITIANLRGLRESGNIFAVPTYLFVGLALSIIAIGAVNILGGTVVQAVPQPDAVPFPDPPGGARDPAAAEGLRGRVGGADRRRGDRQRRPGVQATGSEERREHDDRDGGPAGDPVHRPDRVRRPVRHPSDRARRGVRRRARRRGGLRRGLRPVRAVRRQHGADPVPGREHQLQRLPAAGRDPGRGRLHAAPVLVPRRPAGLLVGHRPAGGDRVPPAVGVRRRHPGVDPALLGRRVRLLHGEPDRDGPPLADAAKRRLAMADGRQRGRRRADGDRPRHRRVREVRSRRLPRS